MNDPNYLWINSIRQGDVLLERGKRPRIVREVSQYIKYGSLKTWVTFSIKRMSWTTRCYTVLNEQDLRTRKFVPAGIRKTSMSYIDKKINYNILNDEKITLTAREVIEARVF